MLAYLVALAVIAGCSSSRSPPPPRKGRVVVAITIDWEGAYISAEGLEVLEDLRKGLGAAPVTHFVSAAYFTKTRPDPEALASITEAVHAGDELALHLHGWKS